MTTNVTNKRTPATISVPQEKTDKSVTADEKSLSSSAKSVNNNTAERSENAPAKAKGNTAKNVFRSFFPGNKKETKKSDTSEKTKTSQPANSDKTVSANDNSKASTVKANGSTALAQEIKAEYGEDNPFFDGILEDAAQGTQQAANSRTTASVVKESTNPFGDEFDTDAEQETQLPANSHTTTSTVNESTNPFDDDIAADAKKEAEQPANSNKSVSYEEKQNVVNEHRETASAKQPVAEKKTATVEEKPLTASSVQVEKPAGHADDNQPISKKDADALLKTLNDYCKSPSKEIMGSHSKKLAKDVQKSALLSDLFAVNVKQEKVTLKNPDKAITHAQLNQIADDLMNSQSSKGKLSHGKNSPLIISLRTLYKNSFVETNVAKTEIAKQENNHNAIIAKSVKEGVKLDSFHTPTAFNREYNDRKKDFKDSALQYASGDGQNIDAMLSNTVKFAEYELKTAKIYKQAEQNSKALQDRYQLDPMKYPWKENVKAYFGRANVANTTEFFLQKGEKASGKYDAKLKGVLDDLASPQEVSKKISGKATKALERASAAFIKEGGDPLRNPFSLTSEHAGGIKEAVEDNCNRIASEMVLQAADTFDEGFTETLSKGFGKYDNKKAEEDSKNTKSSTINNANVFNEWYDTFAVALTKHDSLQKSIYADAKSATAGNPNQDTMLKQLSAKQTAHRATVVAAKSEALRSSLKDMFDVGLDAGLDAATKDTSVQEKIPATLRSIFGIDSADVARGKRVINYVEQYNNKINAAIGQIRKDGLAAGNETSAVEAKVAAFKESLPSVKEMLDKASQALPPTRSVGQYLRKMFTSPAMILGTSVVGGAAMLTVFAPVLASIAAPVAIIGGFALGVIALWRYSSGARDRAASREMHKQFDAMAKNLDPTWKKPTAQSMADNYGDNFEVNLSRQFSLLKFFTNYLNK